MPYRLNFFRGRTPPQSDLVDAITTVSLEYWRVSEDALTGGRFTVQVTGPSMVSIGCERHSIDEWLSGDWTELCQRENVSEQQAWALREVVATLQKLATAGCENVIGNEKKQ
jgi:hypothetical protein